MQAGFDPSSLSDADLKNYISNYQNQINRLLTSQNNSPTELGLSGAWNNDLTSLKNEQAKRETSNAQKQQQDTLISLFGGVGGTGGAGGTGGFDQQAYNNDLETSAANQRGAVNDIYNNQQAQGLQGIDERYNPQRKQAIEEAGVLGNLRSPAFQSTTLANMDASRSRDTSNLLSQLGSSRGQALTGVEQGLAGQLQQGRQFGVNAQQSQNQLGLQRTTSLANLLQGNNQFGQTFGLQNQQFNAGQGQQGYENQLNNFGLNNAIQSGNRQAQIDRQNQQQGQFSSLANGIGGLAGGLGGLFGGLGKTPKVPTGQAYA